MEMASYHILITNEYHVISYITNYFSNITLKFNKGPKSRGNTNENIHAFEANPIINHRVYW